MTDPLGLLGIGYQFSTGFVLFNFRWDFDIELRAFFDLRKMEFTTGGSITESETKNCKEGDAKGLYLEILAGGLLFSNANRQSELDGTSTTLSSVNFGDPITGRGTGYEVNQALDNRGNPTGIYEITIGTPVGGPQYGIEKHYGTYNYTDSFWGD